MNVRRAMRTAVAVVVGGVMLSGCGSEQDPPETATSTSSSSSTPTYDEAHIMSEVRKVDKTFRALDPNVPKPADADWVTDKYRTSYNSDIQDLKESGVVQKGDVTTKALHLAKSDPEAPGGWLVTVYNCNVSTARAYIDGEDVSADPQNLDKPLPKGPRDGVSLDRYTTPDHGKSWQIDDSQILSATDAKATPCET